MKALQVIMPMAGRGKRYLEAGYEVPKPLIEVRGEPMFRQALRSIQDIGIPVDYRFVVLREHCEKFDIEEKIRAQIPAAKITVLKDVTRGAAETVSLGLDGADACAPLLIMDCDLYFQSAAFQERFKKMAEGQTEDGGAIVTFHALYGHYSFAEIENGKVSRTAEKVAISDRAIIGAYAFSSVQFFKRHCEKLLEAPPDLASKEYYISHVINRGILAGGAFFAHEATKYYSFGTATELTESLKLWN